MGCMSEPTGPRSVKISDDERGGWSSDRPRREGPSRPANVSVRGRVLRPTDRQRYSPPSLLVIVSGSRPMAAKFADRLIDDKNALLSMEKVRGLIAGRVADEELEERAQQLLDAAVEKRLAAGVPVVIVADTLDPAERERYVRMAHAHRRPRHLILVEAPGDAIADEDRTALNELRNALDAGLLGEEGFDTSMRLGGRSIAELKRIVFRPTPPKED
jgi:hypothetical protein